MMLQIYKSQELLGLVDQERGTVDRRIFSDKAIYQLELERIFARAWNFMAHDSQIANPGDFSMTFIGEDRVIVVRDNDGNPQVLVNSCRHRGNAVCRAEEGHATSFMCTYHGWTYDLKGALVGVPGFKEVYHEDLDRDSWGLIKAAQVDTYKGFIFATMDLEAPKLPDFLGQGGRFAIDLLADQGDMCVISGVEKYVIGANWKFAMDNVADFYHGGLTHASATMAGYNWSRQRRSARESGRTGNVSTVRQTDGYAIVGEYGHVATTILSPENSKRKLESGPPQHEHFDSGVLGRLAELKSRAWGTMSNVFPNAFITVRLKQIAVRMPKGPASTEIWYFTLSNRNLNQAERLRQRHRAVHTFGAAGMLEQDDGENWDQSTRGARGAIVEQYPLNYQMGLGHGDIVVDETALPHLTTRVSESLQLWQYRAWAELMSAEKWSDWIENHSRPEVIGTL